MRKAAALVLVCMLAVLSGCGGLKGVFFSEASYMPQMLHAPTEEDFEISEFPGVEFRQAAFEITADGKPILEGTLISDIYLADFNEDGLPEFCGVMDSGSVADKMTVVVYDFHNDKYYRCPSPQDGVWWMLGVNKDNKLVAVLKRGDEKAESEAVLSIVDGELIAEGIEL